MKISRRQLLKSTVVLAGTAFGVATATACGDNEDDSGDGHSGTASGGSGTNGAGGDLACEATNIADNHGHALTVPEADVLAGVEKTYSMGGPHEHSVTLTADHFSTLQGVGDSVTVTSGVGAGHTHAVTVTCS